MIAYGGPAKGITMMSVKMNLAAMTGIAAVTVLMLTIGCGVLGNPSPCNRTLEMRNALEGVTGRDCDLITNEDLARVRNLPHRGGISIYLQPLKRSDFSGLDNLRSLSVLMSTGSEWPSVLNTLDDLQELRLIVNVNTGGSGAISLPANAFRGLGSLEILRIESGNFSGDHRLLLIHPDVFNGLDSLRVLNIDIGYRCINWLTLDMLEDLPMLETLGTPMGRTLDFCEFEPSPDVMNALIQRGVKPFAQ